MQLFNILFILGILGVSIYFMILLNKVLKKTLKALDMYIESIGGKD